MLQLSHALYTNRSLAITDAAKPAPLFAQPSKPQPSITKNARGLPERPEITEYALVPYSTMVRIRVPAEIWVWVFMDAPF